MKFLKKLLTQYKLKNIDRKKVYIIPTFHGMTILVLACINILIAATYGSNLVHLFSFILLGIFMVTAVISNSYLKNVEIQKVDIDSQFVFQKFKMRILIKNKSREYRDGFKIELSQNLNFEIEKWSLEPQEFKNISAQFEIKERGIYKIPYIKISTIKPLGLFYVWSKIPINTDFYAYPEPVDYKLPMDFVGEGAVNLSSTQIESPEDFYQHRSFKVGESLGQVDWKALARGRPKLIKEFKSKGGFQWNLQWEKINLDDLEEKLSQFSYWIKQAQERKINIHFRHPRVGIMLLQKPADFRSCLGILATENRIEKRII